MGRNLSESYLPKTAGTQGKPQSDDTLEAESKKFEETSCIAQLDKTIVKSKWIEKSNSN